MTWASGSESRNFVRCEREQGAGNSKVAGREQGARSRNRMKGAGGSREHGAGSFT